MDTNVDISKLSLEERARLCVDEAQPIFDKYGVYLKPVISYEDKWKDFPKEAPKDIVQEQHEEQTKATPEEVMPDLA